MEAPSKQAATKCRPQRLHDSHGYLADWFIFLQSSVLGTIPSLFSNVLTFFPPFIQLGRFFTHLSICPPPLQCYKRHAESHGLLSLATGFGFEFFDLLLDAGGHIGGSLVLT